MKWIFPVLIITLAFEAFTDSKTPPLMGTYMEIVLNSNVAIREVLDGVLHFTPDITGGGVLPGTKVRVRRDKFNNPTREFAYKDASGNEIEDRAFVDEVEIISSPGFTPEELEKIKSKKYYISYELLKKGKVTKTFEDTIDRPARRNPTPSEYQTESPSPNYQATHYSSGFRPGIFYPVKFYPVAVNRVTPTASTTLSPYVEQPPLRADGRTGLVTSVSPGDYTFGADNNPWVFPVAGPHVSERDHMARRHKHGGGYRDHQGVDIFAAKGTPVVAIGDGEVMGAKYRYLKGGQWYQVDVLGVDSQGKCLHSKPKKIASHNATAGTSITIRHGNYRALYLHLNNDAPGTDSNDALTGMNGCMAPGTTIKKGQLIGYVGDSGNAEGTPPHLHFEIWKIGAKRSTNPTSILESIDPTRKVGNKGVAKSPEFSHLEYRKPGKDEYNAWYKPPFPDNSQYASVKDAGAAL